MSYDLYFGADTGRSGPTVEEQRAYFSGRAGYEVTDAQAWYSNEDTGVYFCFDLGNQPIEVEEDEAGQDADTTPFENLASFNLNYFRPHFFGLEAALEVEAFVQNFDLVIDDPQLDGMGQGRFTAEGFLKGWNHGNAFAYRAMAQTTPSEQTLLMPTSRLDSIWRWNFNRKDFQAQLGDTVFVPKMMFLNVDGAPRTFCAWGDAIPVMLPEVDLVFIPRQQLAPRRFLAKKQDMAVVSWSEIAPLLAGFESDAGALRYFKLDYAVAPGEVQDFLKKLPATTAKYDGVGSDTVLNAEIMADVEKSRES